MAVTEKLIRATALVNSLGKGELLAWSMEDKELVAPYAKPVSNPYQYKSVKSVH